MSISIKQVEIPIMTTDFEYHFPDGCILIKLVGRQMTVAGQNVTVKEILAEKFQQVCNERWAVFRITQNQSGGEYILKSRYELTSVFLDPEERICSRECGRTCFDDELNCLRQIAGFDRAPRYIQSEEVIQREGDFFPGGYLRHIVMTVAPGQPMVNMWDTLTQDDKLRIRQQMADTLEYLRLQGWGFCDEETDQIFYDPATRQICLIGFSRVLRQEIGNTVITPTSGAVAAFGSFGL